MNKMTKALSLLTVAATLALSSCILSVDTHTPTKGKELIDLKEARKAGAISQSEYEAQKKSIMDSKNSNGL